MKTLLFTFFSVAFCLFADAQSSYLDSTFGTNGIVFYHVSETNGSACNTVAIQSDDKILAAGAADGQAIIIRYNDNGSIDPTFGMSGIFTSNNPIGRIALLPDGKIVTVGESVTMRLNPNGILDNTYGIGGVANIGIGSTSLALQPDGKIIIAGGGTYTSMTRLLANGSVDSSFGVNGLVMDYFGATAYGVALMPDGSIVLGGLSFGFYFMASRYLPDGTLDTTFNHTGYAINLAGDSYNYCHAMQLQTDGKVILSGSGTFGPMGNNFALVRYNVDGSLDASFGDTGIVNVDFGANDDEATTLYIAPDGKILVAGEAAASGQNFALARLNANGSIDSAFGNNGKITTSIQDNEDFPYGIALQQDGKIILAGNSFNGTYSDYTLARYIAGPTEGISQVNGLPEYPFLYPNPSVGKLYISGNTDHITKITASDIAGKEMDIGAYPPYREVLANGLADGIYFFNIYFDNQAASVQKIIVLNNR